MNGFQLPSERHLRFHRRQWIIYLMGCTAMAVGTIVAVLTPGENPKVVLVPTVAFFALMIVLSLVERVRCRAEYEREQKRILTDEWTLRGMNRAKGTGMLTMVFVQPPLALLMAYVPPEPSVESSVIGMSMMTIALGCGTWAASYLYHTGANPDE
jgi:MFS family permease